MHNSFQIVQFFRRLACPPKGSKMMEFYGNSWREGVRRGV